MVDVIDRPSMGVRGMNVRDYLLEVAHTYDRAAPMDSHAQILLRSAGDHLAEAAPAGLRVTGSGGQGVPTFTPWVGFFDPDETTTPRDGLYMVYLFAEDLRTVTLMLQQGVTRLRGELKAQGRLPEFRGRLRRNALWIRSALSESTLQGWALDVDLGSDGWRQKGYEAGNVAACRYSISSMPGEEELRADLWHLASIYQRAILARKELSSGTDEYEISHDVATHPVKHDLLREFRPKDDADYIANISARKMRKQRRHETLIAEYGTAMQARGFVSNTNVHPQDLMLHRQGYDWLIEAKVVYAGNATVAVRDAVGQLLAYRHFLHSEPVRPKLAALFTEPIGPAYVGFLESLDIAAVWKTPRGWNGSHLANADGIIP